jgi:hypothetical protein
MMDRREPAHRARRALRTEAAAKRLKASTYANNSPGALPSLWVQLFPAAIEAKFQD